MDVPVCAHSILFRITLLNTNYIYLHDVLMETITSLLIIFPFLINQHPIIKFSSILNFSVLDRARFLWKATSFSHETQLQF